MLPSSTQVLIAGGGPVGLAAAVELARRGIECLVIEPRVTVSHARPRCKTVNVRTLEHLRRWGLADRLRERAPLPVAWSNEIVFCTSLTVILLFQVTSGAVPTSPLIVTASSGVLPPDEADELLLPPQPARATSVVTRATGRRDRRVRRRTGGSFG